MDSGQTSDILTQKRLPSGRTRPPFRRSRLARVNKALKRLLSQIRHKFPLANLLAGNAETLVKLGFSFDLTIRRIIFENSLTRNCNIL
jgi:hypothetical protein